MRPTVVDLSAGGTLRRRVARDRPPRPRSADAARRRSRSSKRRVTVLPSFTRFGVVVIAFTLDAISRIVGLRTGDLVRRIEATPPPRRVSAPHPFARLRVHLGDLAGHDEHGSGGMTACRPVRLRRPDHRLGCRRRHHGGGPRRGGSRRDRGRGRPVGGAGSVVPFSLEQMDRQYRSGGVTVALGLPSIAYTEGRCAGGGTEVNSGLYRRPPAETLERWRAEYAIDDFASDDIEAICDEVEAALSVQTVPGAAHRAEREAAPRCRAARLAPRRDPALDGLSRAGQRRRRSSARA